MGLKPETIRELADTLAGLRIRLKALLMAENARATDTVNTHGGAYIRGNMTNTGGINIFGGSVGGTITHTDNRTMPAPEPTPAKPAHTPRGVAEVTQEIITALETQEAMFELEADRRGGHSDSFQDILRGIAKIREKAARGVYHGIPALVEAIMENLENLLI